jgi:hypothetical protein
LITFVYPIQQLYTMANSSVFNCSIKKLTWLLPILVAVQFGVAQNNIPLSGKVIDQDSRQHLVCGS